MEVPTELVLCESNVMGNKAQDSASFDLLDLNDIFAGKNERMYFKIAFDLSLKQEIFIPKKLTFPI